MIDLGSFFILFIFLFFYMGSLICSGFFFFLGFFDMFWAGLLSKSLDSFIFLCISDCTRDLRLKFFLNFFGL